MKMKDMVGIGGGTWAGPMTLEYAEEQARDEYEQYLRALRFREDAAREGDRGQADRYQALADQALPRYEAACRVLVRVRSGEQIVFKAEAEV